MLLGGVAGCWQVNEGDRSKAEFHTNNVIWGHGATTLGHVNLGLFWQLSGPTIIAKPVQIRNTRTTTETTFYGHIMNGAKNVVGSVVASCSPGEFGTTLGGILRTWTPKGCSLYDGKSWDHESVVEFEWRDVTYPGTWFIYIKSPVAHTQDKAIYLFTNHNDLPGSPWSAGWHG